MASELPGWCKQCGEPLSHTARSQGRAREFCNDTCRQRHHRRSKLLRELQREVGLTRQQVDRLLSLYAVSARTTNKLERDVGSSRMN